MLVQGGIQNYPRAHMAIKTILEFVVWLHFEAIRTSQTAPEKACKLGVEAGLTYIQGPRIAIEPMYYARSAFAALQWY